MKKQFPFWAKCLLVVAVLAAGYFWYTRPMTLEQICPSFRWAEATRVGGWEEVAGVDGPPVIYAATLPIDDPDARAVFQRCRDAKFRRDPLTALVNRLSGRSIHYYGEAGGIPQVSFADTEQWLHLMVTDYGDSTLHSFDINLCLRCTDETLFQDLLDYLRSHPQGEDAQPSVSL